MKVEKESNRKAETSNDTLGVVRASFLFKNSINYD